MGKDRAAQIWAKQALAQCVKAKQDFVSAGEVARFMQISRNTAQKRLDELCKAGEIESVHRQKGRVDTVRYCPKSNKVKGSENGN